MNSHTQSPNEAVQSSIEQNLKIIGDSSAQVGQKKIDAKRALALIAELTGKSLPPNTMLDRKFVTIGNHAISQGSSYDVFLGEYFTGEKIAIKVLRHRVDEETAKRTHQRFARLTENWSALRHDCVLPFYGVGVMQSPVSPTEYQLYLVSPYLKNQDIKRYIRTYPNLPRHTRLQMALDIARGLKYMHDGDDMPGLEGEGMVHSALNIYNVLVKDSGSAVISGLGHSKVIKDFQVSFTGDNSEYRYMGPEILDDAVLTFGSDIWSWAMTSLEILTDEPPFGEKTKGTKIIQMVGTNKRPERGHHPKIEGYEYSDVIWQLFEDCWKKQPEDRPSAREVVQRLEPFVRTFNVSQDSSGGRSAPLVGKPESSGQMSILEVIAHISRRGFPDVTSLIDLRQCSTNPFAGGGFGDVYRGYLRNGLKVAIKCPRAFGNEARNAWAIVKEGYTWSKHQHPNILESCGIAHFKDRIALVSPWMENGTVMDYVAQHPEVNRPKLCAQVARGLAYLHAMETIHGDIKGSNVLISPDGVAKLTDFGSTILKKYSLIFSGDQLNGLTTRWAAPEHLMGGPSSRSTDVYSLGMTVLEIMMGKVPFDHLYDVQIIAAVCFKKETPARPKACLPEMSRDGNLMWGLLESCWAYDPEKRPTAADVEYTLSKVTPGGLRVGHSSSLGPPS